MIKIGIVNKATMTIRCPECGYENRDMYPFCGMCGATLRREASGETTPPEPPPARTASAVPPVITPDLPSRADSAAGSATPGFITGEPAPRNLDYLLEDDTPRSHGKLLVTLLLLFLAAGLTALHWRRDGYPWASRTATPPSASANSAASTPPASVPAPQQPAPAPIDNAQTPAAEPATEQAQPAANPVQPPEPAPQAAAKQTPPPADSAPDTTAHADSKPGNKATSDDSSPDETQPAAVAKPAPAPPAPKAKPEPKPAVAAAPALAGDDKLVTEGEKYLYGNGVPENCDLAEKNIRTAAGHSNARALTLMGAMYATGHCVARDLPTAYRWFAKALHQDPSNTRVQQDLEILWKQMTPEERQLATRSGG